MSIIFLSNYMAAFIITFRETLEAALIVGLLLSLVNIYYQKYGKWHTYIVSWVITGIVLSFLFAFWFYYFFWGFEWKVEKLYEWILMIVAFAMITHLLVWTNRNAKKIQESMKSKVSKALEKSELWVLFVIATLTVSREWVETVIFMNALDIGVEPQNVVFWLLGILGALFLSCVMFFGLKKINISKVFAISNTLLLFIAAWLLAHGIVEFQGAWVLPTYIKPLFDISSYLSESEWIWSFFKAMFWYDANPSLLAVIAYTSFLIIGFRYLRIFTFWRK